MISLNMNNFVIMNLRIYVKIGEVNFVELIMLRTGDGLDLSIHYYQSSNPRGVINIIHGLKEHKERYTEFAEFLCSQGYHVIISDMRGHGASINDDYPLGYIDSWQQLLDDQWAIHQMIQEKFNLPVIFFGHSFGSILARLYIRDHGSNIDRLILSGTPHYTVLSNLLLSIKDVLKLSPHHSKFISEHFRVKNLSWTNIDPDVVEQFMTDPLSSFDYYDISLLTILAADNELSHFQKIDCQNPHLPILLISGEWDPITGGVFGLNRSIRMLKASGYQQITSIVYPKLRHELINSIGKEIVWQDIDCFLTQSLS